MNNIHQGKIKKLLASFDLEALAISSGFRIRKSGKITALNFLTSFFSLIIAKCYSQRQWAISLSNISNESISFQAIAKRLNSRSLNFVKALIAQAISNNTSIQSCIHEIRSLSIFNRVLIEDSTCIKLPDALFSEFPGMSNQNKKNISVARIQLCVDIKNGDYINYNLDSYTKNDSSYASNILEYLKPNDLVIRDLGYSSMKIFNEISNLKAFYISRFNQRSIVHSPDNQELIDLSKVLKKVEKAGLSYFESNYIIGGKDKLKCRVICTKLNSQQIQNRKKHRQKGSSRNRIASPKSIYLNTWNIIITNIAKEKFSGQEIFKLYTLRWHIELIFKTWKSYINLDSIFQSCQGPNRIKPQLLLQLCLCFIVVVVNPQFKRYQKIIYRRFERYLSPMKFMKTILNNQINILEKTSDLAIDQIRKNCCYDIRKDRTNIYERIIYL